MHKLAQVLDGWSGYQTSLLHAVTPLTPEQLAWRAAPERRSVGELIRHISLGRITWFSRMSAPGIEAVATRIPRWFTDGDGARHVVEESVPCDRASVLAEWLTLSWQPIQRMLDEWTVGDLFQTYPHRFRGIDYKVSRQWTVWRIMSHDMHHGGQLAMMLAMQGVEAFELRGLGGHITMPELANSGDDRPFRDAVQGLRAGDFSRLEPLFLAKSEHPQSQIVEWHKSGYFEREPEALQEAFTCACFLGQTEVARFLLGQGVDPNAGNATGANAFHWAANRGQLDTVKFLIEQKLPLETKNRYGGTVLDMAVWSAIHEPRADHAAIIEALLTAGAKIEEAEYPTGNERVDQLLRHHGAK